MGKIYVDFDMKVPRLGCTDCGKCNSIMGKSLCKINERGCCHYFPEFTLYDIHRMVHIPGGKEALDVILKSPETKINNFSVYAKGFFDKEGYDDYIDKGELIETGSIKDHTIFFRACPFVKPGYGCLFPSRFRTTVCNFFICSEILEQPHLSYKFKAYIDERTRYARWVYRESTELQHILTENSVNLLVDFEGSIKLLQEITLSFYDFPELPPVEY